MLIFLSEFKKNSKVKNENEGDDGREREELTSDCVRTFKKKQRRREEKIIV